MGWGWGGLLSSCSECASHRGGFSCCGVWILGLQHLLHCTQAGHGLIGGARLSYPEACRSLIPRPKIDPVFPALAGRFLTTGPPRKSLFLFFCFLLLSFKRSLYIGDVSPFSGTCFANIFSSLWLIFSFS